MAKFKVYPPTVSEEELNLMLEAVSDGVAVVVVEDGKQTQTLIVFDNTGCIIRWPIVETFAARKGLRVDSHDHIVVKDQ